MLKLSEARYQAGPSTPYVSSAMSTSVELEGVIVVSAFDLDGSILAIDLVDSHGEHYLIADNRYGEYLLRHIGKKVCVEGLVTSEDSIRQIEINKYQIMMIKDVEKK